MVQPSAFFWMMIWNVDVLPWELSGPKVEARTVTTAFTLRRTECIIPPEAQHAMASGITRLQSLAGGYRNKSVT